jgi:fumarate reductase subunit C
MKARHEGARTGPGGGATHAENPRYTPFHPRWHRRRMPIFWWLRKGAYVRFITRELTSLAVGYTAALLVVQGWFLAAGPEAYGAFRGWLLTPWVLGLHTFVLLALVYHSVTWLNLAPKALALKLGRSRIPGALIILGHYAGWLAASVLVLWVLTRGGGP